jgi:hypothetical protein
VPAGALGEKWRKGWGEQLSAATKMANSLLAYVPLIQCPDSAQQSRLLAATAIAVQSGGAACLRLAQALRHSGGTASSWRGVRPTRAPVLLPRKRRCPLCCAQQLCSRGCVRQPR